MARSATSRRGDDCGAARRRSPAPSLRTGSSAAPSRSVPRASTISSTSPASTSFASCWRLTSRMCGCARSAIGREGTSGARRTGARRTSPARQEDASWRSLDGGSGNVRAARIGRSGSLAGRSAGARRDRRRPGADRRLAQPLGRSARARRDRGGRVQGVLAVREDGIIQFLVQRVADRTRGLRRVRRRGLPGVEHALPPRERCWRGLIVDGGAAHRRLPAMRAASTGATTIDADHGIHRPREHQRR